MRAPPAEALARPVELVEMNPIECAWLTLNRQCNLRCYWCYASGKHFAADQNMDPDLYRQLIAFLGELKVREIALIGGEPTCHKNLPEFIQYAGDRDLQIWLITNGIRFSESSYLNELADAGLGGINFSLKGWSQESYVENTGVDAFFSVVQALKNMSDSGVRYKVSFVISDQNISHLLDAVHLAVDCGANDFFFSIEHDFSSLDGRQTAYDLHKPSAIIDGFTEHYDELDKVVNGRFTLHQSLPICLWDEGIIQQLTEKKQIFTSCSLLRRSGLVFDTDGALLPCNAMHQLPIGKFGSDFCDEASFNAFWQSERITSIYDVFRKLPSLHCNTCDDALKCGGGCISNWYRFSYRELIQAGLVKR